MTLTSGARLGVHEVTAQIGEGGMVQVFRATDTKLKHRVAIKILPPSVFATWDEAWLSRAPGRCGSQEVAFLGREAFLWNPPARPRPPTRWCSC